MGLRETLNKNPIIVYAAAAVLIGTAGYFIFGQIKGGVGKATGAYYTSDDGKTWFEDDINKAVPYTVDGKETYRAYVFSCKGNKFVGFVEKYTPEYKAIVEKANAVRAKLASEPAKQGPQMDPPEIQQAVLGGINGRLIKKPGDTKWYRQSEPGASNAADVKCPDGTMPDSVTPAGYLQ